MGIVISFLAVEFYTGMKNEQCDLVVDMMLRYWPFFYVSDMLLFFSPTCLTIAVNLMIRASRMAPYNGLCWAINAVSFVAFVILCIAFKLIKQKSMGWKRHIFAGLAEHEAATSPGAEAGGSSRGESQCGP